MNTRSFFFVLLIALLLSACSPAAPTSAPQPIAAATRNPVSPQKPAPTAAPTQRELRPQPTPPDNQYHDYGINPMERTNQDHLSTFGLDVDTAAYTVMRNNVMSGSLPPMESVRVEEYVNYFNPGYALPRNTAFAVYADGALSPFHNDGSYLVRFGVQGYQVSPEERKPLALTLVIDVSGSMSQGNRLNLVQRSLQLLVDELTESDTVSIVTFSDNARLVLPPTSAAEYDRILDEIYALRTENSTNVRAGLQLGYQQALKAYQRGATNRVILCSDGVANVGLTNAGDILDEVAGFVKKGITLTTVGVGMGNFNDELLEQLADRGNGNYAYVDTLEEARRIFVDNLTSTMEVIALNARAQVDFNPDVVSRYRLLGYENRGIADQDFRDTEVDAGEIGSGHHVVAVYAVQLKPKTEGRIATFQLRWEDPNTRKAREINGNFNSWDLAPSFESADPHFQLVATVAQYAEILRQSPYAVESSLSEISRLATRLSRALPEDPDVVEWADLVSRTARMRKD